MKTLVLIPIKNKETLLMEIIKDIETNIPDMDCLFLDYGSKDRTRYLLANNNMNRIELPIEGTYEDAISLGIKFAYKKGYDNVLQFDIFKGLSTKDIKYFIGTMKHKKVDMILGSRFVDKKSSLRIRHIHIKVLKMATRLMTRKKITDPSINFRMINRKVMNELVKNDDWTLAPSTVSHLIRAGYKFLELQIRIPDKKIRQASTNKIKLVKYVWYQTLSILFVKPFKKRGKNEK